MRDFTLTTYQQLLETLIKQGYRFTTFKDYQAYKLSMLNVQFSVDEKSTIKNQK